MPNLAQQHTPTHPESNGGRLVTADGRTLPLTGAALKADAKNGVARVVLEQTFKNPYREPLSVTYLMPLPADGAVSGYAFRIGDTRIVGEVDKKQAARERFEQAIVEGRTAGLVDQERSSLFTQEVGNIPGGATVVAELTIDQKLAWLPDGAWEWRFPTVVAPRYLGATGRVVDAAKVTVDVADQALPVRLSLTLSIRDALPEGLRPESPSHPLHSATVTGQTMVSLLSESGAALDRDVVVRWPAASLNVGAALDLCRPRNGAKTSAAAYGLCTVIPPSAAAKFEPFSRDLIVLLDTSGSMSGEPLDQARRIVYALVDSLGDDDQLELIEFSSAPRRWKSGAVAATAKHRKAAKEWLAALSAGGGTEMRSGILEALAPLRGESQRQVVLITDGLIGSEHEVLKAIDERLPAASRVHVVGVGSGVNRSLTGPASRAGRGVELVIGLGEDAERAAKRLVARTCAPLVTGLRVEGSAVLGFAPEKLPDLFGGAPSLISLKLRPEGGDVVVRGRTEDGLFERRLHVPPSDFGSGNPAVAALYAREAVEDLEMRAAVGRGREEVDPRIEQLGLEFQISTRLTSWVAVSDQVTVDPTEASRRENMPHELPHGMSAEGLGLRRPMFAPAQAMELSAAAAPGFGLSSKTQAGVYRSRQSMVPGPAKGGGVVGGIADKAKEVLGRLFSTDDGSLADEEAAPAPRGRAESKKEDAPAAPAPAQAPVIGPRRLTGTVRLLKGLELIVEVRIDGNPVEWDLPGELTATWDDGSLSTCEIDSKKSSRPQTASPGVVLRVALKLPAGRGGKPPRSLTVMCRGVMLEIVL